MVPGILWGARNAGEAKVSTAALSVIEWAEHLSPGMGSTNIDGPAVGFGMA
jgi:hypothetical protein